jgi:hypothetical protein
MFIISGSREKDSPKHQKLSGSIVRCLYFFKKDTIQDMQGTFNPSDLTVNIADVYLYMYLKTSEMLEWGPVYKTK